jgi:DNA polymerase II small subunit
MEQMIEKRHLAPIYGKKNALAPESEDYLALKVCPDILVTGHIHSIGQEDYKGVKLIN